VKYIDIHHIDILEQDESHRWGRGWTRSIGCEKKAMFACRAPCDHQQQHRRL